MYQLLEKDSIVKLYKSNFAIPANKGPFSYGDIRKDSKNESDMDLMNQRTPLTSENILRLYLDKQLNDDTDKTHLQDIITSFTSASNLNDKKLIVKNLGKMLFIDELIKQVNIEEVLTQKSEGTLPELRRLNLDLIIPSYRWGDWLGVKISHTVLLLDILLPSKGEDIGSLKPMIYLNCAYLFKFLFDTDLFPFLILIQEKNLTFINNCIQICKLRTEGLTFFPNSLVFARIDLNFESFKFEKEVPIDIKSFSAALFKVANSKKVLPKALSRPESTSNKNRLQRDEENIKIINAKSTAEITKSKVILSSIVELNAGREQINSAIDVCGNVKTFLKLFSRYQVVRNFSRLIVNDHDERKLKAVLTLMDNVRPSTRFLVKTPRIEQFLDSFLSNVDKHTAGKSMELTAVWFNQSVDFCTSTAVLNYRLLNAVFAIENKELNFVPRVETLDDLNKQILLGKIPINFNTMIGIIKPWDVFRTNGTPKVKQNCFKMICAAMRCVTKNDISVKLKEYKGLRESLKTLISGLIRIAKLRVGNYNENSEYYQQFEKESYYNNLNKKQRKGTSKNITRAKLTRSFENAEEMSNFAKSIGKAWSKSNQVRDDFSSLTQDIETVFFDVKLYQENLKLIMKQNDGKKVTGKDIEGAKHHDGDSRPVKESKKVQKNFYKQSKNDPKYQNEIKDDNVEEDSEDDILKEEVITSKDFVGADQPVLYMLTRSFVDIYLLMLEFEEDIKTFSDLQKHYIKKALSEKLFDGSLVSLAEEAVEDFDVDIGNTVIPDLSIIKGYTLQEGRVLFGNQIVREMDIREAGENTFLQFDKRPESLVTKLFEGNLGKEEYSLPQFNLLLEEKD